eukprot:s33_g52.t1
MGACLAFDAARLAQEGDTRFEEKFRYMMLFSGRGHRELAEMSQGRLRILPGANGAWNNALQQRLYTWLLKEKKGSKTKAIKDKTAENKDTDNHIKAIMDKNPDIDAKQKGEDMDKDTADKKRNQKDVDMDSHIADNNHNGDQKNKDVGKDLADKNQEDNVGKDLADKNQEDKDMDNDIADKSQESKDVDKDIARENQEDKDMDNDIADKSQENKDVNKDIAHENEDGNHNQKAENVEDEDSDSSSSSSSSDSNRPLPIVDTSNWNSDWHDTWEHVLTLCSQVDSGHKRRILISLLRIIAHCHTRWHEER